MGINETIGRLVVEIGADIADFKSKMSEVQEAADASTKAMEDNLKRLGTVMAAIGGAITAFATVSVKDFAKTGEELANMSAMTGMSTEWLSKMSYAATSTGSSLSGLVTSSRLLSQQLIEASNGGEAAQKSFAALGLNYQQLRAMSPEEQFETVLKALGGVSDETERAALAIQMFGRSGTQMLPMLANGADGLEEMMKKAEELGYVMSGEDVKAAEELDQAFDEAQASMKGMKNTIGEALAPAVKALADLVSDLLGTWNRWADDNPALARTITEVAVAFGALLAVGGAFLILYPRIVAGMAAIGIAADLMTGPIGWVTLAVTALGAAFLYLSHSADEARKKQKAALEDERDEIKKVYDDKKREIEAAAQEKITQAGEEKQAAIDALDAEESVAERYYDWKSGQLEKTRDQAIDAADAQLDAAQKAYNTETKRLQDKTTAEIREIERVRDARLAALQEQLDALDRLDRQDDKDRIATRKREIEAQLEVVQTEEKRQELLSEYANLDKDLASIAKQEKRDAIQEQMDNIRATAQVDIEASRERLNAELTRLNTVLETAVANSNTAKTQADTDYQTAKSNLESLILTSMNGTDAERAVVEAKWTSEMSGQLNYQTQWMVDHEARVAAINEEYDNTIKKINETKQAEIDAAAAIAKEDTSKVTSAIAMSSGNFSATPGEPSQEQFTPYIPLTSQNVRWDEASGTWKKMAQGGSGTVYKPTLFLAGEAGPEDYAFGKAASQTTSPQIINMPINYFLGNPSDADRLLEWLNSALRRQQRANLGEATF